MTKIAFITGNFPKYGGVNQVTGDTAIYLHEYAPEEFEVFAINRPGFYTPLPERLQGAVTVIATDDIPACLEEYGIDILVQCSRMRKDTADIVARTGVKSIFIDHGEPFNQQYEIMDRRMGGRKRLLLKRLLWHLVFKWQYRDGKKAFRMAVARTLSNIERSNAYVVLCDAYREEMLNALGGRYDSRLRVIENAAAPVPNPSLDKEKLIIYVGRLSDYDKKPDRLLRIWKAVQDSLPDYRLMIVGDGYEKERLEKMADELGLRRYSFEGRKLDVSPYYRKADILCLVSRTEGWGLCIAEAQAHGVIPVVFNCSGGVETLVGEDFGFLVPDADEDAFAETLIRVARLPEEEKMEIRRRCIASSGRFTPDSQGRKWLELFREAASGSFPQTPHREGQGHSCS